MNQLLNSSRRTFLARSSATAIVAALPRLARPLLAEQAKAGLTVAQMRAGGATAKIDILRLRGGLNILAGSGGNIVVLPGKDGKVAVDSGYATSQAQIEAALHSLSDDPHRHLINTHWHYDHTDGNAWMHRAGATIIALERTRFRMSRRQIIPAFEAVLPPSPTDALPTITFPTARTFALNGEVIHLRRYTPAHTDTDTSVFFARANLLHTGDTWFNGYYPFIDYNSGGSIRGMIAASSENLALANNETIVVPGHGAPGNRQQLLEFDRMLRSVLDRVSHLKRSGQTLDAVIAIKPTAKWDSAWGNGFISPDLFTQLVYQGV
jgi:glyoxylase-like metal-dependent hydrolase (beta-lactamase superfamily II)